MQILVTPILLLACWTFTSPAQDAAPTSIPLFVSGEGGYHTYRIPAIAVSRRGTVLAFCEGRKKSLNDDGDIDLLLRRSVDGGKTWQPIRVVHEEGGDAPITIGNPCPIAAADGTIYLLFCRNNRQAFVMQSTDDGATFSEPREITESLCPVDFPFTRLGTGPGHAIETVKGRLVAPVWLNDRIGHDYRSGTIYSDDKGVSWKVSRLVPADVAGLSEGSVVELSGGRLLINMRNRQAKCRAVATSDDGGQAWTSPTLVSELVDPQCQGTLLRLPGNNVDQILFSNAADTSRQRLALRSSTDDGRTWSDVRVLHSGPAAYSDLAVAGDGAVLCLYECGQKSPYEMIALAHINVADLPTESAEREKWSSRLLQDTEETLRRADLEEHEREFVLSYASQVLATSGHAQEAFTLVNKYCDRLHRNLMTQLIAAGQSQCDDVTGALHTLELLPEGVLKQRTLVLIVARQAQRHEFDDAMQLLKKVTDQSQRNRALELICHEYLELGKFSEAADLAAKITDPEVQEQLRQDTVRIREKPSPGDPDFIKRTIEQSRRARDFLGLSERDAQFLRLQCRAEVAIHKKDSNEFHKTMDEAQTFVKDWQPTERRSALACLGRIYSRFGDNAAANSMFRQVLSSYLESSSSSAVDERDDIDFGRIFLSVDDSFRTIAKVMPDQEIEQWVARMTADDEASDLIGGLAGAAVEHGKNQLADRLYGMLKTPYQRFHVAADVLDAMARVENRK